MRESGINVTLTNHVRELNEKKAPYRELLIAVLGGVYLILGLLGMFLVLTDTVGVKLDVGTLVKIAVPVGIAVTLVLSHRQWKYAGMLFLIVGTAVWFFWKLEPIVMGMSYIGECIGAQFDRYFLRIPIGNALDLAHPEQLTQAAVFLCLVSADLIGACIFLGHLTIVPAVLFVLMDVLCLVTGLMPSLRAAALQGISVLGMSILGAGSDRQPMFSIATRVRSAGRLQKKIQLQLTALLLGLALLVGWVSSALLLDPTYQRVQEIRTQSNEIKRKIQEFALQDWNRFDFSPFKRGNMGINGGKLGDYRSVSAKHQVDLELTSDVDYDNTVFIKGFAGGLYAGNRWKQIALNDWANTRYGGDGEWSVVSEDTYMAPEYVKLATVKKRGPFIYGKIMTSSAMRVKLVNAQSKYSYLPGFVLGSHFGDTLPVYGWAEGIGRNASFVTILTDPVKLLSATLVTDRIDADAASLRLTDGVQTVDVDYGQFVKDNYLQIPQGVLDGVRADWEAWRRNQPAAAFNENYLYVAQQIASYLEEQAKYSLTPGKTPADRDFVEYFLLEQKAGYCVHFASAGTMLFRMCGIPARYVEGYTTKQLRADVTKEIDDSKAHAWVEIYVSGIGWVPVDVTPGSSGTEELMKGTAESEPESSAGTEEGTAEEGVETVEGSETETVPETGESIAEGETEEATASGEAETVIETVPVPLPGEAEGPENPQGGSGTIPGGSARIGTGLLRALGWIVFWILLFFAARYLLRRRSRYLMEYRKAQMRQEECRSAILCAFQYTGKLSVGAGRPVEVDLSAVQLQKWYPDIPEELFVRWSAMIEETYFSSHAMTEEDRQTAIDFYQAVYEETLKRRTKDGAESAYGSGIRQFLRRWISCYPSMQEESAQ